jgi:hypothetical protein
MAAVAAKQVALMVVMMMCPWTVLHELLQPLVLLVLLRLLLCELRLHGDGHTPWYCLVLLRCGQPLDTSSQGATATEGSSSSRLQGIASSTIHTTTT